MSETYWNGLPTPAERVRVVVDTSPVHTWWCADLAGTERAAVRVGEPGGEVIYLDDEDGSGWWKVTEGRGSPQVPHRSLPVVREVDAGGDEYHTLDELYEYRMLYNALVFNEWAHRGTYPVVKSTKHSDGEDCFGGGWFIVVAQLPTGQISNHYKLEHWDLFRVDTVNLPPAYDGHTPQEAARRMHALLTDGRQS